MVSTYKLYTDGSHYALDKLAGIGGYIEDPKGNVIEEFSELISDPNLHCRHEALAMKKGLELCLAKNILYLECYSDDKTSTQIYNIKDEQIKKYYFQNSLSKEILFLIEQFKQIHFTYLPREYNKHADSLSRREVLKFKASEHYNHFVPNSLVSSILESSNKFSSKEKFYLTNKTFEHYILVDCNQEKNLLVTYYACKNLDTQSISYKILESKPWLDKNLKSIISSLISGLDYLKEKHIKRCVISCYGDPGGGITHLMRGKIPINTYLKDSVQNFVSVLNNFDVVRYHLDEQVVKATIQPTKRENKPVSAEKLLEALRKLGDPTYYIGKEPDIENLIPIKSNRKRNVSSLQKMYMSAFLKKHIEDIEQLDTKIHPEKKKQLVAERIQVVKEDLHNKGIRLKS